MPIHQARLGLDLGRCQTGQNGVLEATRHLAARREKGGKLRVRLIAPLEHVGHGVRDVVDHRATQPALAPHVGGFFELAAPVFEGGRGAAHHRDDTLEQVCQAFTAPGGRYGDRDTAHVVKARGTTGEWVVVGIEGQHTEQLARAECDAGINHPDQPIGKGDQVPGSALKPLDRLHAHHR